MKMNFLALTCFFGLIFSSSHAQLAKLTSTGDQQYRHNIKRPVVIVTPFSKAIRSTMLSDMLSDGAGGYLKYKVLKGEHGISKQGAYVHFMRLDGKLAIKLEMEVSLLAEGSENMDPVTAYENGNHLNLITAGPDKSQGKFNLTYWQFDVSSLALIKKNITLASLPFDNNKVYDFSSLDIKGGKGFVITILEEGGKNDNSILHALHIDENLSLTGKRSTQLPFKGKRGSLLQSEVNGTGTVFCLLGYPDEKDEEIAINSLLVSSKDKSQIISLTHKGAALINCAIGLSSSGEVLLSGLVWPGKKDNTTGFVVNQVRDNGTMALQQEELFSPDLLKRLENASKKGLKKDYYVRSVSQRANGVVDVVLNNCSQSGGWSGSMYTGGSTYSSSTNISDAVVFSFQNGKLVSTLPLKRNMEHNMQYGSYRVRVQKFSIPRVFTQGDDLFLMYFDNPSNSIGSMDGKKPKWCDFIKGSLVLAKVDKNFKPIQQQLIQFDDDGEFRLFYELSVNDIGNNRFILTTDKYKVFSKNVKTASILVEVK